VGVSFLSLERRVRDYRELGTQLLDHADAVRREVSPSLVLKRKSALGQFMTPSIVARFMASLFPPSALHDCRLLDPGAGVGALSCAFLDRWTSGAGFDFLRVEAHAFEIDPALRVHLEEAFANYVGRLPFTPRVSPGDFIPDAAVRIFQGVGRYTHAILNPPYKKINSDSQHRLILRRAGIETVNLYSAFVALSLAMMEPGGQLVAIIPRSFCNGPYYRPFRDFLLSRAAIHHIHLFASRNTAFKDDDVLQENIIIRLERGGKQGTVTISNSTDDRFADLVTHEQPFDRIVFPDDTERFIHVPTSLEHSAIELFSGVRFSLDDIGVSTSTGPVVDFRLQTHIRPDPAPGTVPLLYPGHFKGSSTHWPKDGIKRGNAIALNSDTMKWLYPSGFYTVVRRFSAKEERRRIVANVVRPDAFSGASMLGFENHLNVFHHEKRGLPESLAYGLAAFLNTVAVDDYFRRFNGHTQVNATDLRLMKYPSRSTLMAFGEWVRTQGDATEAMLDDQLKKISQ
jgi:adenine-specific DNA-methyltransferase